MLEIGLYMDVVVVVVVVVVVTSLSVVAVAVKSGCPDDPAALSLESGRNPSFCVFLESGISPGNVF